MCSQNDLLREYIKGKRRNFAHGAMKSYEAESFAFFSSADSSDVFLIYSE